MKFTYIIIATAFLFTSCSEEQTTTVKTEGNNSTESIPEFDNSTDQPVSSALKCTGVITVPPNSKVIVYTPIEGLVDNVNVLEGENVRKGQVIGSVSNMTIIKMQEEYLKSKSSLGYLEADFKRKKELLISNSVSQKEFQSAEKEYNIELANNKSLAKQLQFIGINPSNITADHIRKDIVLTSPINGNVGVINANKGTYATTSTPLFEVIDNHEQHLDLNVFVSDIHNVHIGDSVYFNIAGSNQEFKAVVRLIANQIDSKDKTVKVHADIIDKSRDLITGATVFARIVSTPLDNLASTPLDKNE